MAQFNIADYETVEEIEENSVFAKLIGLNVPTFNI